MPDYLVPTGFGEAEFIEKRSRFIGRVWLVESEDEALAHLEEMRKQHWDATHNVYAYILHDGPTRFSDDGEPGGTAGMPVLEVLRREGIENILCVVTRYFGGILLGAGGLVRAYTKGAKIALDAAGVSEKRVWCALDIPCSYKQFERIKLETEALGGQVLDVTYDAGVTIHALLPEPNTSDCIARLIDLSGGTVQPVEIGKAYRAFPLRAPKQPEE